MGRQAKLRQKGGYWASDAGGKTTYFGRVTEVSHAAAMCKLHEHLATAKTVPKMVVDVQPGVHLTVNDLAERFLNWVLCHRGTKAHKERCRHLQRFRDSFGDLLALEMKGRHLEAFVDDLKAKGHALGYIQKHVISIGAMYRKGGKEGMAPRRIPTVRQRRADPPPPEDAHRVLPVDRCRGQGPALCGGC